MKKIISFLLAICISLTLMSAAFAADKDEPSIVIGGYEFVISDGLAGALKDFGLEVPEDGDDLLDAITGTDAAAAAEQLRLLLDETRNMTDDELRARIQALAEEYGYSLDSSLIEKILTRCRELESLSVEEIANQVEQFKSTVSVVSSAKGIIAKITGFIDKISDKIDTVIDFLEDLFS